MPIYEYYCEECQAQVDLFFRSYAELATKDVVCPQCQGTNLQRLVSRVSVVHSGQAHPSLAESAPPPSGKNRENSQELADLMRQAQTKAGQDLGQEFKEVADRLERGEKSASIEQSLRQRAGQNKITH